MGLGPGGNVPLAPRPGAAYRRPQQQGVEEQGGTDATEGQQRQQQQGGGGSRAGGGGEDGAPQRAPNYDRKEKNKAAVANHHRKDRALKKMGMF